MINVFYFEKKDQLCYYLINKRYNLTMVKLVTKKASSEARQRAHKIINDVHKKLKKEYVFFCRPIGSQTRRCIVPDKNGKYDLDYQIILTKKSKGEMKPTPIKKKFLEAFTFARNKNEKVEDSTTVITVRCSKDVNKFNAKTEKFSFDFVILDVNENYRIKRKTSNEYTWCELPTRHTELYKKYNKMNYIQQKNFLEEYLLPNVIKEKQKNESERKATIEIFYEQINNYLQNGKK